MTSLPLSPARLSRRSLVGTSLAGAAILSVDAVSSALAAPARSGGSRVLDQTAGATPTATATATMIAKWPLWVLSSASEFRPVAPPASTKEELAAVIAAQTTMSDATKASVAKWGSGPAVLPWSAMLQDLYTEFGVGGFLASRYNALVNTAIHDAAIAAWDAQVAYNRQSPAASSDKVTPASGVNLKQSSYPSEHATIAATAAAMLGYIFPTAVAGRFDTLAKEVSESRIAAGAAFQSDIDAGMELGKAVAGKALARAKSDGSDVKFDPKNIPTGPGKWQPTPPKFVPVPIEPLAGSWKPWLMEKNDEFRPAPPPIYGSAIYKAEVEQVQETVANRTLAEEAEAAYNQKTSLLTPIAFELIRKHGLDLPHAARVLAYLNAAGADSAIAIWDTKYTWWTARPITEAPKIVTAFPTPNYPSYPSGYSAAVGVASIVLGHFFPEAAEDCSDIAWRASKSRAWAGIHYMIDNEIGLSMGRSVGRLFVSKARADGVDSLT